MLLRTFKKLEAPEFLEIPAYFELAAKKNGQENLVTYHCE